METLGVIGLLAAIGLMIYIIFKGMHVIPACLLCSVLIIFTSDLPLWKTLTDGYAVAMKNFVGTFLIMFFLGAVFGEMMGKSGAARTISYKIVDIFGVKRSILAIILASAILSYGGVSVFIIVFSMYPITLYVFKEADVNKNLLPAAILLGAGTFTMTSVPGTPALTNIIPTQFAFLKTTATAAPIVGMGSAITIFITGYLYLLWADRRYRARGEHFVPGEKDVVADLTPEERAALPPVLTSIIPIIAILVFIFVANLQKVNSLYAVCLALTCGIALSCLLFWKQLKGKIFTALNTGGAGSIMAILNTAAVVGVGGVVSSSPAFKSFINFAMSMSDHFSPLVSAAMAVNVVAGITGSSSGGLTIFMNTMGQSYMDMGLNPEVFHRICTIAAGVLDSLPHAGPNITFMVITGLVYRKAYPHMFAITCLCAGCGLIMALVLASIGLV
ncbi:MAG: GntP family permease [Deltaproteobacteria bacterium]|jgi:H+/gluconate symporter-like permease|nr:GntP family permease [Deltaproteobacteria bacterium]